MLRDIEVARQAAALFATMNREWWASPTEAFIYNEFADALREGLRLGVLEHDDLMTEDLLVLAKLEASGSRKIARKLKTIRNIDSRVDPGIRAAHRPQGTLARPTRAGWRCRWAAVGAGHQEEANAAGCPTRRADVS